MDLEDQLKALADPIRMRIVRLLALPVKSRSASDEGLCACDIESVMGLAQSTVSHHMKILLRAGFVESTKKGRWIYYRTRPEAFAELATMFGRFAETSAACAGEPGTGTGCGCSPSADGDDPDPRIPQRLTLVSDKR